MTAKIRVGSFTGSNWSDALLNFSNIADTLRNAFVNEIIFSNTIVLSDSYYNQWRTKIHRPVLWQTRM